MKRLEVFLPENRYRSGALDLLDSDGTFLLRDIPCLGKADNGKAADAGNKDRNPTLPYGDTPAGLYAPSRVVMFDTPHARMGRGWIPIEGAEVPEGGQALAALEGGRTGLGIHAGRGDGRLVPTYGCLRVGDSDFEDLVRAIGDDEVIVEITGSYLEADR